MHSENPHKKAHAHTKDSLFSDALATIAMPMLLLLINFLLYVIR